MHQVDEIEVQLLKMVEDIQAQARMLSLDAHVGGTAEVAIARLRAIAEYAIRAEVLLAKLPPATELYGSSRQAS